MTAAVHNFTVEAGATFVVIFKWLSSGAPVNLTGATAKLQVRETSKSSAVLFEASTANGKLSIAAALGEITLTITATESTAFAWTFGKYDLEVTNASGTIHRLVRGTVSISAEVTK